MSDVISGTVFRVFYKNRNDTAMVYNCALFGSDFCLRIAPKMYIVFYIMLKKQTLLIVFTNTQKNNIIRIYHTRGIYYGIIVR